MFSALLHVINTIKNTIDDTDYIVDYNYFIITFQYVTNNSYSHSIVNKPKNPNDISGLKLANCLNTMKNTIFKNLLGYFRSRLPWLHI